MKENKRFLQIKAKNAKEYLRQKEKADTEGSKIVMRVQMKLIFEL